MLAIMYSPLRTFLDGDLGLNVGPAAVITEISGRFSRAVIYHRLDDVITGLAELRDCRRFAIDEWNFRGIKVHLSRTAVLGPHDRHADRLSCPLWKSIVGRGYIDI